LQAPDQNWNGSYVNFEGARVVGVTAPVLDTNWVVITEIAEAEAFAVSQTALLLLGGGMAIFGLVVMLVTGRFLGRQADGNGAPGTLVVGRGHGATHQVNEFFCSWGTANLFFLLPF
jgi:hypothetical protein